MTPGTQADMGPAPIPAAEADLWWEAVEKRDASFDAVFRTGVRTTGIYCRPACPARRPFRRNVVFFPDGPSAQRAGFRACLRCRPE